MGSLSPASAAALAIFVGACSGHKAAVPLPQPIIEPIPNEVLTVEPMRLRLPGVLPTTRWRVSTEASVELQDHPLEHASASALVSWTLNRGNDGSLRGSGVVDSFSVTSTVRADSAGAVSTGVAAAAGVVSSAAADSARSAPPYVSAQRLLQPLPRLSIAVVLDSVSESLVLSPVPSTDCDQPEMGAAALARYLLVRIPDGVSVGSIWRDSTVVQICRSGVPIEVETLVTSTLDSVSDVSLAITRRINARYAGSGGSAFRSFELSGVSEALQQVLVDAVSAAVISVSGTETLVLEVSERMPSAPTRTQSVRQQLTLRAERVDR